MYTQVEINNIQDFFTGEESRPKKGVYFYRINGYTEEIGGFVRKYFQAASQCGMVIEGKIPNPNESNLAYYEEVMGPKFLMNRDFINRGLKKWLPRMNDRQREDVSHAMFDTLYALSRAGKNQNMLKNAYTKFMCWLYYRFESVVSLLGGKNIPKILYEGEISKYELLLIHILSRGGCDVLLLQYHGDGAYHTLDESSQMSYNLVLPGMQEFPPDFCLKMIREQIQADISREKLYGTKPSLLNCTNAWMEGKGFEDLKKSPGARGDDSKLFYNCFIRMEGVEDKLTYASELYQFQLEMINHKRPVVIVDGGILKPGTEEIAAIRRRNYKETEDMLMDLSSNITYTANPELKRIMVKAFLDVMLSEKELPGRNLNKLTGKAVYLLCWLKRYQGQLFSDWKMPKVSCFIHMGPCRDDEALFLKFLARLPVDVLVLVPNLDDKCCLSDNLLYEIHYGESMAVNQYPRQSADLHMGTAAYHAERELDGILYQDTGLYRNRQYGKANAVTLKTMYEEIGILWKEELKYRPNFSTEQGVAVMPVIFAKVSGVKDGMVDKYWKDVRGLLTEDTVVVKNVPYISSSAPNPMKMYATEFFKNGRLLKKNIKEHKSYPYGFLREEIQEHILEKLKLLIDEKIIKGTFENGTEYTIIATILNMPKEIVRLLQNFDFTKRNPKLLYFNTAEKMISLEDSILTAFLNLAGFDIVFFVPTGYQSIEGHFNKKLMEEHQIGEYLYDLTVPGLTPAPANTRPSWRDKIFKRG